MTATMPMPPFVGPGWTSPANVQRLPRAMYPLGIDAATQELERRLFDGITSQTPHVGYYAFYSWALTRFREEMQGRTPTTKEFRRLEARFIARLETVLRAATLVVNPSVRGMFGSEAARRDGPLPRDGRMKLPEESPYRTTGVNFYLGPLMNLGCGGRREGSRGEFRTGRGAKVLADAVEAACRQARGGRDAVIRLLDVAAGGAKTIDVADVRTLAAGLALQQVPKDSALHDPLTALLCAHAGPTAAEPHTRGWARSESLAICLDIARQANGAIPGRAIEIVRRAVLTGYLAPRKAYKVPEQYRSTFAALRRLYERQMLQLSLYGFWRDVIVGLQEAPGGVLSLTRLIEVVSMNIAAGASGRECKRWLGADPLSASVRALLRCCSRERRRRRQNRPWSTGEERLALAITAARSDSAPSAAASAFALLLRVAEEWAHRTRDGRRVLHGGWHSFGGRERLALDIVCGDLANRAAVSGGELLEWVLSSYVVGQSLRATVAKGPQSRTGEYVYFIVPDSGGYRVNQPPRLGSYLQLDSRRLLLALRMLEELELMSSSPAFKLTGEGRRLLTALQTTHARARDQAAGTAGT